MSANLPLTSREILKFWHPLAGTWVLMSLEGPLLTSVISRMPDSTANLAAYGIAFIIGLILESPVIMLMSAATALVRCRQSYRALKRFTLLLCLLCTGASIALIVQPIFHFIVHHILQLPTTISDKVWLASVFLIPWPAAIGFRRFLQGVLIASGNTRPIALGTTLRLLTIATCAAVLFLFSGIHGAALGAASLSAGVISEALYMAVASKRARSNLPEHSINTRPESLELLALTKFYWPLFLTTAVGLLIQPIITFFAGRGRDPIPSLAVLPIMNSSSFLFRAIGLSFQEVVLALGRGNAMRLLSLRKFAWWIAFSNTAAFCLLVLTPASDFWFATVAGLKPDLVAFLEVPFMLLFALPALSVSISWGRSLSLMTNRNQQVSISAAVELITVACIMFLGSILGGLNGAIAGAIATVGGRLVAFLLLPKNGIDVHSIK